MTALPIPLMTEAERQRFLAKVHKTDACWIWRGAISGSGYGAFYLRGKMYQAHRVSVRADGYSVPTWGVIDHLCRNRKCVNPEHLRTVLRGTNIFENSEALACINSQKTHCPKGHPYSGENLVSRLSGRRGCRICRGEYHRRKRSVAKQ